MVILMPKKSASKDGRKSRYIPLEMAEFAHAEKSLRTLLGYYKAICDEMRAESVESLPVDGRAALDGALAALLSVARKAQGHLQARKMDLR